MNHQQIPQVNSQATESPAISFDAHTGDLLTKREQILAELALELILTQNKPDGQKVAKS